MYNTEQQELGQVIPVENILKIITEQMKKSVWKVQQITSYRTKLNETVLWCAFLFVGCIASALHFTI